MLRLPRQSPESAVFDSVLEHIDDISGELALSLLKPYEFESQLKQIMESVRNTNRDPHLLFSQLGKRIGFIPEARVKEAFVTVWCRLNSNYVDEVESALANILPKETDTVDIAQN